MDARGFDSGIPRTNARGSRLRRRDAAFVAGAVAVCAAAVVLSVADGQLGAGLQLTGPASGYRAAVATSTRYVVLLRGINLGKARQVAMPRLTEVLTERGHARGPHAPAQRQRDPRQHRSARRSWRPTCAAGSRTSSASRSRSSSAPAQRSRLSSPATPSPPRRPIRRATWSPSCPKRRRRTRSTPCRRPRACGDYLVARPRALPLAARRHPGHAAGVVEVGPAARRARNGTELEHRDEAGRARELRAPFPRMG